MNLTIASKMSQQRILNLYFRKLAMKLVTSIVESVPKTCEQKLVLYFITINFNKTEFIAINTDQECHN